VLEEGRAGPTGRPEPAGDRPPLRPRLRRPPLRRCCCRRDAAAAAAPHLERGPLSRQHDTVRPE